MDDRVVSILESIDRRLALLTAQEDRDLRRALSGLVETPARQRMWDAIDEPRGTSELAAVGGMTPRAALNFVTQLLDLGLLRRVGNGESGRAIVVEKDQAGIVDWYLESSRTSS